METERESLITKSAGLHISGPNANRSSVCVIATTQIGKPFKIIELYEKIGSFGKLFSDERLVNILQLSGPFAAVFVDCPLTLPPCVACDRPSCPGTLACEDTEVAYMLSLSEKLKRRRRPINPQSQRTLDLIRALQAPDEPLEPTYSANLAPLVMRARTIQRRLNSLSPRIVLKETSVKLVLKQLQGVLNLSSTDIKEFRSFERGFACRSEIYRRLEQFGIIAKENQYSDKLVRSVDNFQSFICALLASLHSLNQDQASQNSHDFGAFCQFEESLLSEFL